jgi:hypothetical protein
LAGNAQAWSKLDYTLANYSHTIVLFHFTSLFYDRKQAWRKTALTPLNEYHVIWGPIVRNELDRRCHEFGQVNATTRALICVHEYNLSDPLQPLFSIKGDWWWLREDFYYDYMGCNISKCKFKKKQRTAQ